MKNKLFLALLVLFLISAADADYAVFAQDQGRENVEYLPAQDQAPPDLQIPPQEETVPQQEPIPAENEVGFYEPQNEPQPEAEQPTTPGQISISKPSAQNRISLDIKGMDIVDVLKMLSQRAGLNIVIGRNVMGRVTLFLKDVDIWDAFEILLLANDLAYEKKGDIYSIMTQRDYELQYGERYQDKKQAKIIQLKYARAQDLSRALNQIKTNVGRIVVDEGSNTLVIIDTPEKVKSMEEFIKSTDLLMQTRVFSLNYAQADKIQPKIQEIVTKGIGSVKMDERTNKIAVTDYPDKLDEIEKIITAFDEQTPQVLIDAQIIEIRPTDEFKMGVDWEYWIKKHFKVAIPLAAGATVGFGSPTIANDTLEMGDSKAMIDLLRVIGNVQILSSPRIAALNNQEAGILIGTKEVYVEQTTSQSGSGTQVTADQVKFVDVGIKLHVTPTINRDGFVIMKIKPEISSVEKYVPPHNIPLVATSEAETTVMIKDGVTIMIAGLRKDQRKKVVSKIPILGDIPGLGFLFRQTTDGVENSELVILLTPHLLSGGNAYTDYAQMKPTDGATARMVRGKIITEKVIDVNNIEALSPTSSDYYRVVMNKLKNSVLSKPKTGENGQVSMAFTLNSKGELKDEPRVLASSNQGLNGIAIICIKEAAPFPPFPKDLDKPEKGFQITLEYK